MIFAQAGLSLLVVWLSAGVMGRYGMSVGLPQLMIIIVWLSAWLGSQQFSLRQTLMIGLLLDLLGYTFFGFWTGLLIIICLMTVWIRKRLFSVSSWIESLLSLLIVTSVTQLIFALFTKTFATQLAVSSILTTVILGMIGYYAVAVRLRLFAQWRGTRV